MTQHHTAAPSSFGERMKEAREQAGLSTMNAAYAIRSRLPEPLWISNEPIRRMENGKMAEEKADPILVCALAAVYGVEVRTLSPLIADALGLVDQLLHATGRDDVDEQGIRSTIWEAIIDRLVREGHEVPQTLADLMLADQHRPYDVRLFEMELAS